MDANALASWASSLVRAYALTGKGDEGWLDGDLATPNPAEEMIAAAVSIVRIVIEVVSTAALRSRGNRGAQPRHYVIVL